MYWDTSYIAKVFITEPDSLRIRNLLKETSVVRSSQLACAELHSVLHRSGRERRISSADASDLADLFHQQVGEGLWELLPVTETLVLRTSSLLLAAPIDLFIRTSDALHLATAMQAGEREVWTSDRHMLAAASYFGLKGRSI